ncbi:DUF257 family protein [Thermococcus sp.]
MEGILDKFKGGESVLVEYNPLKRPELFFYEALSYFRAKNMPILIIDILDTLHIFKEHLKFTGIDLQLDDVCVLKEGGKVRIGRILGDVPANNDFSYHAAKYSKTVRPFFMKHREETKVIFVLGIEKFVYPFQDDMQKMERYFETIERPLIAPKDKITFLFINKGVVNPRVLRSMESDKPHVIEIDDEVRLIKKPGVTL